MKLKPYEQGYLDGYCGIYSIINACRLIDPNLTEEEAGILFRKIMQYVETQKKLSLVSTGGLCTKDMEKLLKEFLPKAHRIAASRPFRRSNGMSKAAFFQAIKDYLEGGKGRAVIAYVRTVAWDHWTVVRKIKQGEVICFDSAAMDRFRKDLCRVGLMRHGNTRVFIPGRTFFLWSTVKKKSGKEGRRRP
ncbi:MAG: hypothetical protein AB2L22_08165 [Syntrophales bacterium]